MLGLFAYRILCPRFAHRCPSNSKVPVTPKIFSMSWPKRAEFSLVSMTSVEDARFSALRFHPASEWMNSAVEEFPLRFMACGVVFENFETNY